MNDMTIGGFGRNRQPQTMSSREIAKLTGKEHKNVIRDIRTMLDDLVRDGSDLSHVREDKDSRGYTSAFHLDRELTETLLTGYSATLRRAVIRRWQELEAKQVNVARPMPRIDVSRECRLAMGEGRKWAKEMGLIGNQAILAANRLVNGTTGIDPLGLMGITYLDAPQNEALLSPTEIGNRLGSVSGQTINKVLCRLGLQIAFRDAKNHIYYEPTPSGADAGGLMQDTGRQHSTGAPVRHLRWASSIIHIVDEAMQREGVE